MKANIPDRNALSIRVSPEQHDQIQRAAAAQNKTISDYCRELLAPWAASDLDEKPAPGPEFKVRIESPVVQAAKARGMTQTDYHRLAAEFLARVDLGYPAVDLTPPARTTIQPPPRESGMRLASGAGRYSTRGNH